MLSVTDDIPITCRGKCLDQIEEGEYISVDCPNPNPCVTQSCANFPLCGNAQPQWVLDCHGGLCVQPCDMMYGRIFEFSTFEVDDMCPICLEEDAVSVVFPCEHMVCVKCYGTTAFNDTRTRQLKHCPMCRLDGVPVGDMRPGRNLTGLGRPMVEF